MKWKGKVLSNMSTVWQRHKNASTQSETFKLSDTGVHKELIIKHFPHWWYYQARFVPSSTTSHILYSTVVPLTARGAHVTLVEAVCLSPASVLVEAAWPSANPVLVEAVCSSTAPVLDQRRFVPPRIPYWIKMAASIDNVSDFLEYI